MSWRRDDQRPEDGPRIVRVDGAHLPSDELEDPGLDRQLEGIAGWETASSLKQLQQQARELADRLREQQRRLSQRQSELDTRQLIWQRRRTPSVDDQDIDGLAQPLGQHTVAPTPPEEDRPDLGCWANARRRACQSDQITGLDLEHPSAY
jgi:hypothetical protein